MWGIRANERARSNQSIPRAMAHIWPEQSAHPLLIKGKCLSQHSVVLAERYSPHRIKQTPYSTLLQVPAAPMHLVRKRNECLGPIKLG